MIHLLNISKCTLHLDFFPGNFQTVRFMTRIFKELVNLFSFWLKFLTSKGVNLCFSDFDKNLKSKGRWSTYILNKISKNKKGG